MWWKRALLILIFLAAFLQLLVNNHGQEIKKVAVVPIQKIIARHIRFSDHMELIYQPGLRPLAVDKEELAVEAIISGFEDDFIRVAEHMSGYDGFALVQCSAMDCWHTSTVGKAYLYKMHPKGYRVVVFDGGHHLPTLGLAPDILIVPQISGYAAHSYMRDGMRIDKIKDLAEELDLPCVIAVLPRWAVFKEQQALESAAKTIIEHSCYSNNPSRELNINAKYHMSKYNHKLLIYINQHYYMDKDTLLENIKESGIADVNKIYLAFDYKQINLQQARDFTEWLGEELAIAVEIVNEPIYVFNAFWGDRSVLSE